MDDYYKQPETQPIKTQEQRLLEAVHAVVSESDADLDLTDVLIDDDDDETLTIRIDGYRIDDAGRIVLAEREYEWTGEVTVTFTVHGTVTATSEDEADEKAERVAASVAISGVDFDGDEPLETNGWDYDTSVDVQRVEQV